MSWNIELDNGDLFSFKSEDEARAFYRGYQYAQRITAAAVLEITAAPDRAGQASRPARGTVTRKAETPSGSVRPGA